MNLPLILLLVLAALAALPAPASAQERPYFVTYTHRLEEPGNLEIAVNPVFGTQRGGGNFLAGWTEFEYGVKAWWTTEFYLDAQTTAGDSSVFTGFRWENRFRPLMREHWINPVLYIEFENLNGADKTLREVVGFDGEADHAEPNAEARREHEREIETKLILSSDFKGWNASENFIAVKNLAGEPWEFGYALGLSRPLALAASPEACVFCPENFVAGLELYGGLGDWKHFTLSGTSHYLAPVLAWHMPRGLTLRISPTFGLTASSHRFLLRFGIAQEFSGFGPRLAGLFSGRRPRSAGGQP